MLVSLLSSRTACYKRHRDRKSTEEYQKKAHISYITWGKTSSVRTSLGPWMFYLHAIYLSVISRSYYTAGVANFKLEEGRIIR